MNINQNYRQLGRAYSNGGGTLFFNNDSSGDNFHYLSTGDTIIIAGYESPITKVSDIVIDNVFTPEGMADWHTKKKVIEPTNTPDYFYRSSVSFDAVSSIEVFVLGIGLSAFLGTKEIGFSYSNSKSHTNIYPGLDWGAPYGQVSCSVVRTSDNTIVLTPFEVTVGGSIIKKPVPVWGVSAVNLDYSSNPSDYNSTPPQGSPQPAFVYKKTPVGHAGYCTNTSVQAGRPSVSIALPDPSDLPTWIGDSNFYDFGSTALAEWTGTAKYLNSYQGVNIFDLVSDGGAGPSLSVPVIYIFSRRTPTHPRTGSRST